MSKKRIIFRIAIAVGLMVVLLVAMTSAVEAKRSRLELLSGTSNGYNLAGVSNDPDTGLPDPDVGWVSYRLPTKGDPNNIIINVKIHKGVPNIGPLEIELVTSAQIVSGGLDPSGNSRHGGIRTVIGTISTNAAGEGQSGDIVVDVRTLSNVSPSGLRTFAHVDVEGGPLLTNDYAATVLSWMQP